MILLCGIPSEPPLARVRQALDQRGTECFMLNQRDVEHCDISFRGHGGSVEGTLRTHSRRLPLNAIKGVYLRLMDDASLPELADEGADSPLRRHSRRFHQLLLEWTQLAHSRVVNRPLPMASNMSKPYQALLIRECGIEIPPTLISDDPNAIRRFHQRHGRVIYKSMSGVRSIVRELSREDYRQLHRVAACPTQFQKFIPGWNVRAHVIGSRVFATRIDSDATDYRYASKQGGTAALSPFELPESWKRRAVLLADRLGLAFAGIDFKVTPRGTVYCFEVNPCPVYSYYEAHTGQPIANAVAEYLSSERD